MSKVKAINSIWVMLIRVFIKKNKKENIYFENHK